MNKEGCTWKGLPHDFPNWTKTDENGISLLDKVFEKLIEAERLSVGREAQRIQNADTAEVKVYDAGKKIWRKTSYWS